MGKAHIKLYVDVHSPVFKSVDVEYVPILLGGLFKTTGGMAPLQVKNKDKWINRERLGWAKQFNIPMREPMPQGFPIPTVAAQRLLTALYQKDPSKLPLALDTLYAAMWCPSALPASAAKPSKGPDYSMNTPEDLSSLLSPDSVLGKQLTDELVKAMTGADAKQGLLNNTNAAYEDGAFGLPWFHCTNDKGETMGFWGFDHLGQVVQFMGLGEIEGASKVMRPLL